MMMMMMLNLFKHQTKYMLFDSSL